MDKGRDKEYLAVLGFANELPVVTTDIGNILCKFVTDQPLVKGHNRLDFVLFPHGIAEVDEGQAKRLMYYHQGKKAFHVIKWRDHHFVVGEQAFSVNPGFTPVQGRLKYSRDYYGILFIRGLVELFDGQVPDAVNAFLAHPPGDLEHTDALKRAVHGKWVFEVNGQPCRTEVVYTNTLDEIVGGVHNATDGVDGKAMHGNVLEGNGPTLVFDLGGGSLDLCYLRHDLAVDYDRGMISVRTGVNHAVETFKSVFDSRYADRLGDAENGIPRSIVVEAFMNPKHIVIDSGEELDCSDLYADAIAPVLREAAQAVRRFAGGFIGINSVLLTGGGSAMVLDEIKKHIFPKFAANGKVFTTDTPRDMVGANVRGGRKIAQAMKAYSKVQADRWLKARNYGQR